MPKAVNAALKAKAKAIKIWPQGASRPRHGLEPGLHHCAIVLRIMRSLTSKISNGWNVF